MGLGGLEGDTRPQRRPLIEDAAWPHPRESPPLQPMARAAASTPVARLCQTQTVAETFNSSALLGSMIYFSPIARRFEP